MSLPLVVVVLIALVAFATAIGLLWRSRQGRVVQVGTGTAVRASDVPGLVRLPRGATLLQFSTEVCSPCRATHTVLDGLARERDGLQHVDLDITHRGDLASKYNILQTPTTLILDATGTVRARIGGAARRETVVAELDRILLPAA